MSQEATQIQDVKPEQSEGGDNQTINVKVRPAYAHLSISHLRIDERTEDGVC